MNVNVSPGESRVSQPASRCSGAPFTSASTRSRCRRASGDFGSAVRCSSLQTCPTVSSGDERERLLLDAVHPRGPRNPNSRSRMACVSLIASHFHASRQSRRNADADVLQAEELSVAWRGMPVATSQPCAV